MIKKIFSTQSHTITGAAILLGGASFLSRLIGLARDRVFAHYFGAGDVLDAYYAAFLIPDFLFNLLLAGAITVGFVPIFLELWHQDKSRAWQITNSLLALTGLVLTGASALAFIFTPQLMNIIAPGFVGEKLTLTISLTRIMLISPILLGLSGVISSVLHALRQFVAFSIAPLIYNLCIIGGAIWLVPIFGPTGLAWGVVLGALTHFLIQLPVIKANGFIFAPKITIDHAIKRVISLVIPRTLGMATVHINFIILAGLASNLAAGNITVFYLAHNLYYVPIGLIGQSFSLAAFPIFANYIAEGKQTEMIQHFSRVVRQIFFLIIPSMILFIIVRVQIVRVALGTGKFDWTATIMTANVLAILSISLAAHCIMLITARALFALQDVWSTFWTSLVGIFITAAIGLATKNEYGIQGLAGALSLSIIIQSAVLWFILRHKVGSLGEHKIIIALGKMSLGAIACAWFAQKIKVPVANIVDMTRLWGILSQGLICGMVGILAYGAVCYLLKLEEMELFKASFKKRWLKLWHVLE